MGYQETITFILEMIGTIAFAASGALVGSEQKMDIFGVSVLGVITAVGGGMIRDVTLGITPPGVFQKPVYAAVAVLTSVLVFFLLYFKREMLKGNVTYDKVMLVMDSVGLGIVYCGWRKYWNPSGVCRQRLSCWYLWEPSPVLAEDCSVI